LIRFFHDATISRDGEGSKEKCGPLTSALALLFPEPYKRGMLPILFSHGGPMFWVLLATGALGVAVFAERFLHYHRAEINSAEFLAGVRNVIRRDNIVEALSICDATPGPVARLVKTAILNREKGREGIREALEEAGLIEVPRLEEKLNLLATIAQIAPLLGLLGTVLGFIDVFGALQAEGAFAHSGKLAGGVWQSLICTAMGLAISAPTYAGYNYLVTRVNAIVLEMEKVASEILNVVTENPSTNKSS
jgi:biopolymer transport protein ExbB